MAFDTRSTPNVITDNGTTKDSNAFTVSPGTKRTVVFAVVREASATVTAVFDPLGLNASMSSILSVQHSTVGALRIDVFRYDVSDATPDGSYVCRATFSTSGIANLVTLYANSLNNAAAGQLYAGSDEGPAGDANVTLSATSESGAHVLAWALNASASATWTWSGGVTEAGEQNETNYTTSDASGTASGVSTTVTAADGATSNKLLGVVVIAEDAGDPPPATTRRPTFLRAVRRATQKYTPSNIWTGVTKVFEEPSEPPSTEVSNKKTWWFFFRRRRR